MDGRKIDDPNLSRADLLDLLHTAWVFVSDDTKWQLGPRGYNEDPGFIATCEKLFPDD
jgi:hypothetical protein